MLMPGPSTKNNLREKLWRKIEKTKIQQHVPTLAAQVAKLLMRKAKRQKEQRLQSFDKATKPRSIQNPVDPTIGTKERLVDIIRNKK